MLGVLLRLGRALEDGGDLLIVEPSVSHQSTIYLTLYRRNSAPRLCNLSRSA
jgi:hypothetical protein